MKLKTKETLIRRIGILTLFPVPFIGTMFLYDGVFPWAIIFMILAQMMFFLWLDVFVKNRRLYAVQLQTPIVFGLLGVGIVVLLSALFGHDTMRSFWSTPHHMTGVIFLSHLFLYIISFSSVIRDRKHINDIFRCIAFSGALILIFAYIGPEGFNLPWIYSGTGAEGKLLANTTFMGMVLSFVVFSVLYLLTQVKNKTIRVLLALELLLLAFNPEFFNFNLFTGVVSLDEVFREPLLIIGEARAPMIATSVGVMLWVLMYAIQNYIKKGTARIWTTRLVALVVLLGTLMGVILLFSSGNVVRDTYTSASTKARPLVWDIATEAATEKPWLGWGEENFEYAFFFYFDSRLYLEEYGGEPLFDRAHNVLFDILVTRGWVGLTTMLVFIYVLVWSLIRSSRYSSQLHLLSVTLLVILYVHFLQLQTAFEHPYTYVLIGTIIALIQSLHVFSRQEKKIKKAIKGNNINTDTSKAISIILLMCFVASSYVFVVRPVSINYSAYRALSGVSSQERITMIDHALFQSFHSKRYLKSLSGKYLTSLQIISEKINLQENVEIYEHVKKELSAFIDAYKNQIKSNPPDYKLLVSGAKFIFKTHQFGVEPLETALLWVNQAISISPTNPEAYELKILILRELRNFKEIENIANKLKYIEY